MNVSSDSITQLATTHTPDEIAFVKRCLDAMFETNNSYRSEVLALRSTEALRLAKPPNAQTQDAEATQGAQSQGLTMMQAQKILQAMVDEGWFELSKKDYYTLTPRALMELRGWLVETYNDDEDERIKNCSACKAIITMVFFALSALTIQVANTQAREKDVQTSTALVGYTSIASAWPSEHKTTTSAVPYAKKTGKTHHQ